jgi:hypothetical protein
MQHTTSSMNVKYIVCSLAVRVLEHLQSNRVPVRFAQLIFQSVRMKKLEVLNKF